VSTRFNCIAGVQARMGSTRLPGKVLADLGGKPMIQRIVERLRQCALVDEVFVLTSEARTDDVLVERLEELALPYRRGPVDDVLARYLDLVEELAPSHVVRVTGDCPFVEPDFIDLQLGALRAFDADLVRMVTRQPGALDGTLGGQTACSARALRAAQASDDPRDREHVGSFFFVRHARALQQVELEAAPELERPGLRLQVDQPEDLEFVRRVWSAVDLERDGLFPLARALRWIDAHPEVRACNRHVRESADNQALRALAQRCDGAPQA